MLITRFWLTADNWKNVLAQQNVNSQTQQHNLLPETTLTCLPGLLPGKLPFSATKHYRNIALIFHATSLLSPISI